MFNEQSLEPHRQGPAHGGDYDPNERANLSNSQRNNTKVFDSWRPSPSHGGDYDPNHFDARHLPGQNPEQQYDSPSMASKDLRQAPSGQAGFYNPNQTTNSSNPAGSRLGVGASFHHVANLSCPHC